MFIKDIKKEFYDKIRGERVLILVNYDVDAACACKIMQTLFKSDHILFTTVPVDVCSDIKVSIKENYSNEKYIIFLNCGGTIDLVNELDLNSYITCFVLDSHRPLHVCNIYNSFQVRLLGKTKAIIPRYGDIFGGGNAQESSDDEQPINLKDINNMDFDELERRLLQPSRERLPKAKHSKKRNKEEWENHMEAVLLNYTMLTYYERASSLLMYELAMVMSKDSVELLWCAIVGLSEQYLMRKIDEKEYTDEWEDIQNHMARLTNRTYQFTGDGRGIPVFIEFEKELRLDLLRHWTIMASLKYSVFSANRLQVWTYDGDTILHNMLFEMGMPLTQCTQKYSAMDVKYRKLFEEKIEEMACRYSLDGITFGSFVMQYNFRSKYSAIDFAYGLIGLLQSHSKARPKGDCFQECVGALCRTKKETLDRGIGIAKQMLVAVFNQVQNILETKLVYSAGPFLYVILEEDNADPLLCNHPYGILLLAEFAYRAYIASADVDTVIGHVPLIVSTPIAKATSSNEQEEYCHLAGIAPPDEHKNTNICAKAFLSAAAHTGTPMEAVYVDASVIKLRVRDRTQFLEEVALLISK